MQYFGGPVCVCVCVYIECVTERMKEEFNPYLCCCCCCQFIRSFGRYFVYCFFVFLLCGSSSFDSFRGVRAAYILYVCIHILRVFIDWNKCLWYYYSNRFCCCSPLLSSFSSSSSGCQPPFLRNFSYMAFLTLWPNMCICSVWCGTVRYVYECIRAVQSDCV